jgi:hypothetical protein
MVNYLSTPVGEPVNNMASKVGLGLHMPLLAPATATWCLPFAAYYIFLQNRIVFHRLSSKTYAYTIVSISEDGLFNMRHSYMGDKSDSAQGVKDPLYVASRAQLNFAENVPLVLAVALLAELNGANR